jgi:hypothetical protein
VIVHNCNTREDCAHKRLDLPHHVVRPQIVRKVDGEWVTISGPESLICAVCGCLFGTDRPRCFCPRGCHYVNPEEIFSLGEEIPA